MASSYKHTINKILILLILFVSVNLLKAQNKLSFKKIERDTFTEIKKLEADGWQIVNQEQSIGRQLQNIWSKEKELNENGSPKWISSYASAGSPSFKESEKDAVNYAKNRILKICAESLKGFLEYEFVHNDLDSVHFEYLYELLQSAVESSNEKVTKFYIGLQMTRVNDENKNTEVYVNLYAENLYLTQIVLDEMKTKLISSSSINLEKLKPYLESKTYFNK
jgi:hypothetical protein